MPDAHIGYGLPIGGGVLGTENAIIPYAVGVDITCRMKLSVLDTKPETLEKRFEHYRDSLERGKRFGVGVADETPQDHPRQNQFHVTLSRYPFPFETLLLDADDVVGTLLPKQTKTCCSIH